jgi:hypothetical protein
VGYCTDDSNKKPFLAISLLVLLGNVCLVIDAIVIVIIIIVVGPSASSFSATSSTTILTIRYLGCERGSG